MGVAPAGGLREFACQAGQVHRLPVQRQRTKKILDFIQGTPSEFVLSPTDYGAFVQDLVEELRPEEALKSVALELPDPLEDGEIFVQLQLRLPSAGLYDVRLWANERFVHSVSFRASG